MRNHPQSQTGRKKKQRGKKPPRPRPTHKPQTPPQPESWSMPQTIQKTPPTSPHDCPPPPDSPCTLAVIPTPPGTPRPIPDLPTAPLLPPPNRSFWTPFSHASVEMNLLVRPDLENVIQNIYQTFYLGALSPNKNPPMIPLPKVTGFSSLNVADAFLPVDIAAERARNIRKALNGKFKSDTVELEEKEDFHVRDENEDELKEISTEKKVPVSSPWSNFVFDPTRASRLVSPASSDGGSDPASSSPCSTGPLLEMFSAKVPMTPVRARPGSKFVSTNEHSVQIHKKAYAQDNGKGAQILCKAVINDSYTPDVEKKNNGRATPTLTYVGFEYGDETCLTYIPIMETRLLYKASNRKERWFGEEVPMMLRRSVFERIKEMSVRAYLEANPGMRIDCGQEEARGVNVVIFVLVKSNRTVKIELGNSTVYRPVLDTLFACKHDISGEGLLHVRFSKTPDCDLVQLRFILFGIQVKRTGANARQRIFEIAEQEKNDNTTW